MKQVILDGFCANPRDNLKYALRLLNATLSLSDNAADSPQAVSLTGSGASSSSGGGGDTGTITMTPASLNFGTVQENTSSASQAVILHNGTASAATLWTVWVGRSYTQTNNCGSSLAAGASCTINVTFNPLGTGTINENLAADAGGKNLTTTLTGLGR